MNTVENKSRTIFALLWSSVQSVGVKALSLILFAYLTRILTKDEIGVASVVLLVLSFGVLLSEQGFGDAIVQRGSINKSEINALFWFSMTIAIFVSLAQFAFSNEIADLLNAEGSEGLIQATAFAGPLATATVFQSALRRRQMDFKLIAQAALVGNLLGCIVAALSAASGLGAASLIAHYLTVVTSAFVIMWVKSIWPGFASPDFRSGFGFLSFSSFVFLSKLLDFFSSKILDFLVVAKFGLAGFAIYSVGSKMYLTVLQVLAYALIDVALGAFSRQRGSEEALRSLYERFIFLATLTTFPLFSCLAVVAPEITPVVFGAAWVESGEVARILFLLGAIQSLQFFNGPLILSAGKSSLILLINVLKLALATGGVFYFGSGGISEMATVFVVSQLIVTPISFFLAIRSVGMKFMDVVRVLLPPILIAGVSCLLVLDLFDSFFVAEQSFVSVSLRVIFFVIVFLLLVAVFLKSKVLSACRVFVNVIAKKRVASE